MSRQKRVLILSSDAGFGHRSTVLAIAAALEEKYGDQCHYEVINPLNEQCVPRLLRRSQYNYDRIIQEWPELYRLGHQINKQAVTSALFSSSLAILLFEVMRHILNSFAPDVVIGTFPL